MSKNRFIWLSFVAVSITSLLFMAGCGGGGGSTTQQPTVAKATISGTVSFPSLNSLVGKQVSKTVAKVYEKPTVQLRTLSGAVVATATVTGTGSTADPFVYTFSNIDFGADYVVKAFTATNTIKAIVDKDFLATATTKNVDTVSTTAVIITEKKIYENAGITTGVMGSLGDSANTAFTSTAIAAVNPLNVESKINTAIGVVNTAPGSAVQADLDLINIVNVVAASVYNDVDPAKFIAGTATPTAAISTTQFTTGNVATGGTNVAIIQTTVAATLATSTTAYTPPPADSVTFTSRVMDFSSTTAVAVSGVEVTANGLKTYTDANGFYTLAGITKNTAFYIKMSKTGYVDSYSSQMSIAANSNTSTRPYALYAPSKLAVWGNFSGAGVISSRVVTSTNPDTGYLNGAVVTATDAQNTTVTYPVTYTNTSGSLDSTLTSTAANGSYMVKNIPAGKTVTVTATKTGYTFNSRTFFVAADSVSQGRITGTVDATAPATSALKASLLSGWYEIRNRNVYNQATNTNTDYYYVERISLAADNVTMTNTPVSYYDRVSKTWVSSIPSGFPAENSTDYTLSTAGVWTNDNNGPQGYSAVFNSDGTARMTNPVSGQVMDISFTSADISGQAISAVNTDGVPILATAAVNPAGSALYTITISNLADTYQVWNSYSQLTTLASVPAEFAESSVSGNSFNIENSNRAEYFYGKYVDGSTTSVNIYRNTNGSQTAGQLVGTGTASNVTVLGQTMIEVTIPAGLKSTYGLANVIFAVVGGVVMDGVHYVTGVNATNGGTMLNDVAINHIKANINTSLAKPVAGKQISKAILGW